MKKIKFQIQGLVNKFRANISYLLMAVLVVLVFFEILVLKRAITTVLDIARANPPVQASQLVRINFTEYDKIVKRIESAPEYAPTQSIYRDPFGTKVSGKDKAK